MSTRVNSVIKSYFDNQLSRKCYYCKQPFKQGYFSQRFCHNLDCLKRRHVIQQTQYRQRKKKAGRQEEQT